MKYRIDNLQYCNWSRDIFQINRKANLDAVHVTIVYHEDYNELQTVIKSWNNNGNDFCFSHSPGIFKTNLFTLVRPKLRTVYGIHDPFGIKILF